MYIYIYMDARFVCTACLTSSDPPSHLESQLRRGMIHTKIRTEKPVWSCWVHSKWDLTRVKPPFLSKSIHHSMLVFLFTRKFAFLQQSTLHPSSWVNEKLRHRCSHWNHGECTRELSPILTQHFRWVKYDKFTRISYIYIYSYFCVKYYGIIIANRRKFRSETSDNMDSWKAEMGSVREKRRVEERRSEEKE